MRHGRALWALGWLIVAGLLGACEGASPPTATPAGDSGVQIALTTDPAPPRPGPLTLSVRVRDAAGQPVTGADSQVHIKADMPSMGHRGVDGDATDLGGGQWQVRGSLVMGGEWRVVVTVTRHGVLLAQREFRFQAGG